MTSLYSITMGLLLDGKVIVQMLPYGLCMYVVVTKALVAALILYS